MAWSFVQSAVQGASGAGNRTLAYTSNVTAGNLLVCAVGTFNTGITASVSDSQGNTWTQIGTFITNGNTRASLWWAIAKSSAADTVTVTLSAAAFTGVGILEYTPPVGTIAVDASSSNTGTGSAVSCGTCTVSGSNELYIGMATDGSGTSNWSANAGFNLRCNQSNGSSFQALGVEDALNVSTNQAGGFSRATSAYAAMGVSFKASGGGTAQIWPFLDTELAGGCHQMGF